MPTPIAARTRKEWEQLAATLRPEGRAFIHGQLVAARTGRTFDQGETCHAGSRVIAHASIKDKLLEAIARVANTITLGHPFDPATQMGALIDGGHMSRVLGYIDSGIEQGARLALGGKRAFQEYGGYYVEATILDDVRADMRVAREEIFGPVLGVTTFLEEAEAVPHAIEKYTDLKTIWTTYQ